MGARLQATAFRVVHQTLASVLREGTQRLSLGGDFTVDLTPNFKIFTWLKFHIVFFAKAFFDKLAVKVKQNQSKKKNWTVYKLPQISTAIVFEDIC